MARVRESIATADIVKTAENSKGCVDIELFNCISINQIILPILHCEIGLGNYILKSFFNYVDYQIEQLSDEKKDLRLEFRVALVNMHHLEDALGKFSKNQAIELIEIQVERDELKEVKKLRDEEERLLLILDIRKELDD